MMLHHDSFWLNVSSVRHSGKDLVYRDRYLLCFYPNVATVPAVIGIILSLVRALYLPTQTE